MALIKACLIWPLSGESHWLPFCVLLYFNQVKVFRHWSFIPKDFLMLSYYYQTKWSKEWLSQCFIFIYSSTWQYWFPLKVQCSYLNYLNNNIEISLGTAFKQLKKVREEVEESLLFSSKKILAIIIQDKNNKSREKCWLLYLI